LMASGSSGLLGYLGSFPWMVCRIRVEIGS